MALSLALNTLWGRRKESLELGLLELGKLGTVLLHEGHMVLGAADWRVAVEGITRAKGRVELGKGLAVLGDGVNKVGCGGLRSAHWEKGRPTLDLIMHGSVGTLGSWGWGMG